MKRLVKNTILLIPQIRKVWTERNHFAQELMKREVELAEAQNNIANLIATKAEMEVCQKRSPQCVFILGFMRSNTTITLALINTARNAFLLGEASFHLPREGARWSDLYNQQHIEFKNQATKSTYVPDFIPKRDHKWWEWLDVGGDHFDVIGDKLAFSAALLSEYSREEISKFYEARFFSAKYIFTLRSPIQSIASAHKLWGVINSQQEWRQEYIAWLTFIQLWADWVRNFPNTITLFSEDFSPEIINSIAEFTELDLSNAKNLLGEQDYQIHNLENHPPELRAILSQLEGIYNLARDAMTENPALWQQANQKRNSSSSETTKGIKFPTTKLSQLWVEAENLRTQLQKE